MNNLPPALNALAAYKQFIIWQPIPNGERVEKKPINYKTGMHHNPHDPEIWLSAVDALAIAATVDNWGIGFVFTKNDPFFFIDIDHCYNKTTGVWSEISQMICTQFGGCGVEVSQSGAGLHIIGVGQVPQHGCDCKSIGTQFYTEKRFCALTGFSAVGDVGASPVPGALEWLVSNYFPPSTTVANADEWTTGPVPEWAGPTDDIQLITKMMASKSVTSILGGKASIQALWNADAEILGNNFHDIGTKGRAFDHNSADMALCSHLAWWTGKDCARMDRLFRQSKLFRDKWDKREDYRQNTILKAVGNCNSVYNNPSPANPILPPESGVELGKPAEPEGKTGFQYLSPDQQVKYFGGCVYIQVLHRIFTPNGMLLKPEQFKAMYGGFVFALDTSNDKTTKSAWEAFTESQAIKFPKATNIVFRPEQPPGAMIKEEGLILFNNYVPINIHRIKGDVSPFTELLGKLFPDARDKQIIMGYMAACCQYPGKKFQWAPLIQGCEGNGKSLLLTAVSRTVGIRYTHKPPARDISNVFNSWISGKLFIAVEEVYVHDKREVMDALKTLITDDRVPVTPKGVDQTTGDNRANFMCTSNHKDAIRIAKKNNRRWCIFYTPQQDEDDLIRDGMGGSYFPNLYNWCNNGGYAIIADYLLDYDIPDEFNPSTFSHRAPNTSSTSEATSATLGAIEQEILEAIGEGRPGFAGGWVSSMAVAELLKNRRITHAKRNEIIVELGFIIHPGLKGGRVNNIIPLDGGKPKLYIKSDSPLVQLTQGSEIVKHYIEAQGFVNNPQVSQ